MSQSIQAADIHFNESGTPISNQFDDIYYSREDGLTESYYVFQQGNQLQTRWLAFEQEQFVIAETGFGTGLNFLAVCQSFHEFRQQNPEHTLKRLHFISFEKFPLTQAALAESLSQWSTVKPWAVQLLANYPSLIQGVHRLQIDTAISLDLWFGDVLDSTPQINDRGIGVVDAWFLDGFAPSKNPDMWSDELFYQIARLTKQSGSFATFTAAGFVRRGLMQQGFNAYKLPGFGRKREMVAGVMQQKPNLALNRSQLLFPTPAAHTNRQPDEKQVAIIGGGISAISSAYALAQRGYQVSIYTQSHLADAASGNHQGAVYPLVQLQHNPLSELHIKAFEFSQRHYSHMQTTLDFGFATCGVLQLAFNADRQRRLQQLVDEQNWPETLVHAVSTEQANDIAGININSPAWYYPNGAWLNPVSYIKALAEQLVAKQQLVLHENTQVTTLQQENNHWQLTLNNGHTVDANIVILACGHAIQDFEQAQGVEVHPVRGQVTELASHSELAKLKSVICHKGYLTPAFSQKHCAGASFIKDNDSIAVSQQEDEANLAQQSQFLAQSGIEFTPEHIVNQRASIRTCTQDHIPVVGALFDQKTLAASHHDLWKGQKVTLPANTYDNLYCLTGLASRGLSTAPFLAEYLASMINQEVLPVAQNISDALNPNRFVVKKLIRREI
ncbi:bifunctional tRNA (5-methylaminomethyl-2-thiouridine)(34)-methyltransferase MnmD/FAD-dependent 5-carboxymethylaminomethyl-2-thiouridine(34) oxidoreductase MnmC [Saccharobesus litoralis]|uniref:bifunctional tRNA (5-methylaminomethyl-2-thiouridine)(34)-methyltransferase MnmD/FAD-dependent 5-carboxymethylaminomethyl-2-thiouridine(34) oxidoreductase MnmC n=1 Tax=Saccharobesus litoralis TaxID=2172099 RepID=UPI00131F18A7|nr:bifunctional tRNA (5-methylaminomethyl-2-thiouridine)(34)-methyltransferase MnmD/FAD-dependent 5-carboxymethylaminomethyl-2-thiouridine(34) oxidoreductase MnmC [Saccharobesus litoralis]